MRQDNNMNFRKCVQYAAMRKEASHTSAGIGPHPILLN